MAEMGGLESAANGSSAATRSGVSVCFDGDRNLAEDVVRGALHAESVSVRLEHLST